MKKTVFKNIRITGFRFLLFLAIWFILTEGKISGLYFGVIIAFITTVIVYRYNPEQVVDFSVTGMIAFIFYFIKMSVKGGVDASLRAITPGKPRLNPGIITYKVNLSNGFSKLFLLHCIGLFPGSLAIDIEEDILTIHTLDKEMNTLKNTEIMEQKIAGMFREVITNE